MKFGTRLIIFYLATAIVSMIVIGAAIWGSLELYKTKTVENQLTEQSKLIFAYIKQVFLFEEKRINQLNRQNGKLIASNLSTGIGQVQIYNQGLELQCNPVEIEKESSLEDEEYKRLILEPAINGDKVFYTKNKVVYYSVPVVNNSKTIGVLVIVYKLDLLNEFLNKVLYILVLGALAFCCLIVIISIYISKKMVKPINRLVETTERYAKRDFAEFEIDRNDELGQLSKSINSMGSQLQEYIGRQKQFISNVSHEIRTPLTAIKGYSEFLYDEISGNPDTESALVHLKSEASRLEKLVNDHLNLSRLDSFQESFVLSRTNFSNLVLDTAAKLKNKAAERNITVNTNINPGVFINADPERIVQVVINILDNAIKYSHNDGTVEMELYREKNNAVLTVKDHGIGIPREDLKNVFERFHRASNTKGIAGTGLGLAITKIIVDRHNGKLDLESTVNAGTRAILVLPGIDDV